MMSKAREEAVWKRVMAMAAEAPEPMPCHRPQPDRGLTEAQLLELLDRERMDACTYRTLAARTKGQVWRCLQQLALEEQQHGRKLETMYYLLTGRKPCPDRPKAPCVACFNEELRRRYEQERGAASQYRKLAEQESTFGHIFRHLALEEERHGEMILRLLEQCL